MSNSTNEQRAVKRSPSSLLVIVKGRKSKDVFWEEIGEIINVSKLGANIFLQRECLPGHIISLSIDMPKNFRCYDWDMNLYQIWAVVQYHNSFSHKGIDGYQIGVAFVGKHAPKSYVDNPLKTYKISGMDEDGFWNIGEEKTPFISRLHPRFPRTLAVEIVFINSEGKETVIDNDAITKDISVGGAAVFSKLEVNIGDLVRFTCNEYDFSSVCLVRNRQKTEDGRATIHLSFSELKFPIEKLNK